MQKFAHRCSRSLLFSFFLFVAREYAQALCRSAQQGTDIKSTTTRRWTPGLVRKLDKETRFIAVRSGLLATALPPLLKGMSDAPPALRVRRISFWNVPARGNSGLHEMSATFRQS